MLQRVFLESHKNQRWLQGKGADLTSSFRVMKMSKALSCSLAPPRAPYRYVDIPGPVAAMMCPVKSPPTQSNAACSGSRPAHIFIKGSQTLLHAADLFGYCVYSSALQWLCSCVL